MENERILEKIDRLIKEQYDNSSPIFSLTENEFYIMLNKNTIKKMIEEESMKKFNEDSEVGLLTYHSVLGDAHFAEVLNMKDDDVIVSIKHSSAPRIHAEPILCYKSYKIEKDGE